MLNLCDFHIFFNPLTALALFKTNTTWEECIPQHTNTHPCTCYIPNTHIMCHHREQPVCWEYLCNSMKGPLICNLLQSDTPDLWVRMNHILEIDPLPDTKQWGYTVLFSVWVPRSALLVGLHKVQSDMSNLGRWVCLPLLSYFWCRAKF